MREKMRRPGPKTGKGVTLSVSEEIAAPPAYLGKYGRLEWAAWAPQFAELGISNADHSLVAAYCLAAETMQTAAEFLAENGTKYQTETGYWRPALEVKERKDAVAEMARLAQLLGFSPAARAKLPGAPAKSIGIQGDIFGMGEEV